MLLQLITGTQLLAISIIIIGIILIAIGLLFTTKKDSENQFDQKNETKAIVFLGPIPLVWGYSRRTQLIMAIVVISVFVLWFIFLS